MTLLAEINSCAQVPWEVTRIVLGLLTGLLVLGFSVMLARPYKQPG